MRSPAGNWNLALRPLELRRRRETELPGHIRPDSVYPPSVHEQTKGRGIASEHTPIESRPDSVSNIATSGVDQKQLVLPARRGPTLHDALHRSHYSAQHAETSNPVRSVLICELFVLAPTVDDDEIATAGHRVSLGNPSALRRSGRRTRRRFAASRVGAVARRRDAHDERQRRRRPGSLAQPWHDPWNEDRSSELVPDPLLLLGAIQQSPRHPFWSTRPAGSRVDALAFPGERQ